MRDLPDNIAPNNIL